MREEYKGEKIQFLVNPTRCDLGPHEFAAATTTDNARSPYTMLRPFRHEENYWRPHTHKLLLSDKMRMTHMYRSSSQTLFCAILIDKKIMRRYQKQTVVSMRINSNVARTLQITSHCVTQRTPCVFWAYIFYICFTTEHWTEHNIKCYAHKIFMSFCCIWRMNFLKRKLWYRDYKQVHPYRIVVWH